MNQQSNEKIPASLCLLMEICGGPGISMRAFWKNFTEGLIMEWWFKTWLYHFMKKNSHVKCENIEQEPWQIIARKEESWNMQSLRCQSHEDYFWKRREKQRMEKWPREAEWQKKKGRRGHWRLCKRRKTEQCTAYSPCCQKTGFCGYTV